MANDPNDGRQASAILVSAPEWSIRRLVGADWTSAALALVAVLLIVGFFHPDFLSLGQLINVAQNSVYAALIALGLVFLIPQNEIDLSVGGNYVLTGILAALMIRAGLNPSIAALIALLFVTWQLSGSTTSGLCKGTFDSEDMGTPDGSSPLPWFVKDIIAIMSSILRRLMKPNPLEIHCRPLRTASLSRSTEHRVWKPIRSAVEPGRNGFTRFDVATFSFHSGYPRTENCQFVESAQFAPTQL
jgi:hypothetical protein